MSTSKGRILVVEDDPVLRPLLVDTLEAIGWDTVAVADGIEALRTLRREGQFSFDLLITDIKMPHMDGLTLLKRIRRFYPELTVLFISGVAGDEAMAAASADGFLTKPFRIARLEELIENALAARSSDWRPTPRQRVLVSVAREDLRRNISEMLAFAHYLPFEAPDLREALEELERGRFDALITDRADTGAESENRLREISRLHPSLPIVVTDAACGAADLIDRLDRTLAR